VATDNRLSADGFRVLAVAYRVVDVRDAYTRHDESGLVLAGFLSFADPVLNDALQVLDEMRHDGVEVKILTGDNPVVARHVCSQIGLSADDDVITGDRIDGLAGC
jgi:Mg2+-importing ATPase